MKPETGLSPADLRREDIFVTTRWTMVLEAKKSTPQSRGALEEICAAYWFPLYAYVRRRGHSPEDAEDLTQEFFRQLLEHRWIEDVDRDKGRLRAFLLTALKRFMAKEWRRSTAQKRGGFQQDLPLDERRAEDRYATTGDPGLDAESLFDRQWAMTLLELTTRKLAQEYGEVGKGKEFNGLKKGLLSTRKNINYAELAAELDMKEGAVRVAIHRLRKRFRQLYRDEVAQTLPPGIDLDEEMNHLSESLARG